MNSFAAKFLVLSVLMIMPLSVSAAGFGLSEVIQAVESPFKSGIIQDFSGKFFQQSHVSSLNKTQHGEGTVTVKFDHTQGEQIVKFRWHYLLPVEQDVVSDGKMLWVYVPENNQVIESNLQTAERYSQENPMAFLTGLGNLSKDFIVVWGDQPQDPDGNYILHLRPRRISRLIDSLWLVVDKQAVSSTSARVIFPLKATIVQDPTGNRTTIEFGDIDINQHPFDMEFDFIAPAGVDIVYPEDMQFQ